MSDFKKRMVGAAVIMAIWLFGVAIILFLSGNWN